MTSQPPTDVVLWRPRADEHGLAASLGLCEEDRDILRQLINATQEQVARDMPGTPVRVHRWHIWRVVRTMAKHGLLNTPDGRAAAFAIIADQSTAMADSEATSPASDSDDSLTHAESQVLAMLDDLGDDAGLSEQLGWARSVINRFRRGETRLTVGKLSELARAFGHEVRLVPTDDEN
jgi:hypothetical protein